MNWVLLLSCFVIFATAQRPPGFTVIYNEGGYQGGYLTLDGSISCSAPLKLPANNGNCRWHISEEGTRGQTSAVFHQNSTRFFLGQEICENGSFGRTTLFQTFGPFCRTNSKSVLQDNMRVYPLAQIPTKAKLEQLNSAWDHTCNVVVLYPTFEKNVTRIETKQVSEYDGAVRTRPDYAQNSPVDVWRKVNGVGALDAGDGKHQWNTEWNCGEACVMYTLEERVDKKNSPRAFIGKFYRSGILALNLTDQVRVQTLSYVPFYKLAQQFVGIGHCCTFDWCHPFCQKYPDRMVLMSFLPNKNSFYFGFQVLADIGPLDKDTIRLGVEFSRAYEGTQQVYIFYDKKIVTYGLTINGQGIITNAAKVTESAPVKQRLISWGTGFNG